MKMIHDEMVSVRIAERLQQLRQESTRRWGSMTPAEMLFHLNAGIRIALGEIEAEPVGDPAFWHTKGKAIALGNEPWPEGAPTSREALPDKPVNFEVERDQLLVLLERLASRSGSEVWPAHPRFGPLTGEEWGRLTYNHLEHHFRQFGI